MSDEESRIENTSKDSAFASGCANEEIDTLPLVFQCAQCNSILGDSTAWVCANDVLRSITLSGVSSKVVDISDTLLTSSCGPDIGSTYSILQCEPCKEDIGIKYRSTTRELDELRGFYTLHADKLTSYQVGCAEQASESLTECLSFSDSKKMNSQMLKLQTVVLSLDNRLEAVEKYLQGEEETGAESSSGIASPDPLTNEQRLQVGTNNINDSLLQNGACRNKSHTSVDSPSRKQTTRISSDVFTKPDRNGRKASAVERDQLTKERVNLKKTVDSPKRSTPAKRNRDIYHDTLNDEQLTPSAKRHYRADKLSKHYVYQSPETSKARKRKDDSI